MEMARRFHPEESERQLRNRIARAYTCLIDGPIVEQVKRELRGKHLACWCALTEPCHADVLLAVANK